MPHTVVRERTTVPSECTTHFDVLIYNCLTAEVTLLLIVIVLLSTRKFTIFLKFTSELHERVSELVDTIDLN